MSRSPVWLLYSEGRETKASSKEIHWPWRESRVSSNFFKTLRTGLITTWAWPQKQTQPTQDHGGHQLRSKGNNTSRPSQQLMDSKCQFTGSLNMQVHFSPYIKHAGNLLWYVLKLATPGSIKAKWQWWVSVTTCTLLTQTNKKELDVITSSLKSNFAQGYYFQVSNRMHRKEDRIIQILL